MSLWRAGIFLIEGLSNFTLAAYLKQEAKFSKHALDIGMLTHWIPRNRDVYRYTHTRP